jgi:hypothetical protein
MLQSPAYRVLSLSALRVLARIQIELAAHGGKDNGRLPITYDDFAAYGIDRHAIPPALRELEALGFIQVTERGRAGNADWRTPSLYRLTFRGPAGGYDGTDEWRQITEDGAKAIAKIARAAKPEKTKNRWGKKPVSDGENPHRKRPILSSETPTTCLGGETHTTLYIPGREHAA